MRIAVISNLYPPRVQGGYELACADIVERLRARGHEVRVLTGRTADGKATRDGEVWRELDVELELGVNPTPPLRQRVRGRWFTYHNLRVTREFIADYQPDVVYVWNLLFAAPLAILLGAASTRRPLVAHLMDYWLPQTYNLKPAPYITRGRRIKQLLGQLIDRYVHFEALLATSDRLTGLHVAAGFPANRFTTVRHGLDLSRIQVVEPRPTDQQPIRILYAGQVIRGKGVDLILEALGILLLDPALPPFCLDIIGKGPSDYRDELDRQAESLEISNRVRFLGYVERVDLLNRYAQYDIFVFPTHPLEPGGIVVQEAMAAGLAVITSNVGGQSEAITNEHDGILVKARPLAIARALRRLVADPNLRARLQVNARETALAKMSIEQCVDAIEGELRKAAASTPRC